MADYLTVKEVAEACGVSLRTVRTNCCVGNITDVDLLELWAEIEDAAKAMQVLSSKPIL